MIVYCARGWFKLSESSVRSDPLAQAPADLRLPLPRIWTALRLHSYVFDPFSIFAIIQ